MNRDEIEIKVMVIIRIILGREIKPDDVLLGAGGILDSITAVRLINRLEERFNIKFDEDDLMLEYLSTVNNMVSLIEGYIDKSV